MRVARSGFNGLRTWFSKVLQTDTMFEMLKSEIVCPLMNNPVVCPILLQCLTAWPDDQLRR